jgi:CCR4-NOT transcription complex subunit 6
MTYEPDFLCLQDVHIVQYEDYFVKHLSARGYDGAYWCKAMNDADRVDGCAMFYKSDKYMPSLFRLERD